MEKIELQPILIRLPATDILTLDLHAHVRSGAQQWSRAAIIREAIEDWIARQPSYREREDGTWEEVGDGAS